MSSIDKDRLNAYLNSDRQDKSDTYITKLFGGEQTQPELDRFVEDDWKSFEPAPETHKDLSGVLAKVHHQINKWNYTHKQAFQYRLYHYYSAVAAVLIIPLAVFTVLNLFRPQEEQHLESKYFTVQAPQNTRVSYQLPDASQVYLNGGAQLVVPVDYSANRHLKLYGQAHFEVTSDPTHPFVVEMAAGKVEVLGTRFTAASENENHLEVILEEGKVKATLSGSTTPFFLKPNQKLELIKGKALLKEVDALKYTAWKEGKLIFKDDSLPEVVKRLQQWYHVDVVLKDKRLKQYSFRGVFVDESLDEVLRMMTFTLPIRYEIKERQLLPDGSYSKRHVTIIMR